MKARQKKAKKPPSPKPGFKEGLEKGYGQFLQMPQKLVVAILGSMFWVFFVSPATCMKLEEMYPHTGRGFFTSLVMICLWIVGLAVFGVVQRKRRRKGA